MENNNNQCSFNFSHYREILKSALKAGYRFVSFDKQYLKSNKKICFLRHDIDYMPWWALDMARAENKMNIKATYFFQLNAATYNIMERKTFETVHELARLGHRIGLHFDTGRYPNFKLKQCKSLCRVEQQLMEEILKIKITDIISFHCPQKEVLGSKIKGIVSTYEPDFFVRTKYLSDSQGWYEGCVCKIFEKLKYPKLQLVTHPHCWPKAGGFDFIKDMAGMITFQRDSLFEYMVRFHPVCRNNKEKLIKEINKKSL